MVDYPNAPESAQSPTPGQAPAQAPAPAPVRPRASSGSSRGTTILYIVAGLIAVGGVAFAVGRVTAPAAAASTSRFGTGAAAFRSEFGAGSSFAPGAARGFFGGGTGVGGLAGGAAISLRGTVQSINGTTMTVQTASGSTVTVDLGSSTTYHKQAAASATDVTTGSQVVVQVAFNRTGFAAGAGASGAPAGGAPLASGAPRTFTASDVTVVGP
jgi:hypothetical protein